MCFCLMYCDLKMKFNFWEKVSWALPSQYETLFNICRPYSHPYFQICILGRKDLNLETLAVNMSSDFNLHFLKEVFGSPVYFSCDYKVIFWSASGDKTVKKNCTASVQDPIMIVWTSRYPAMFSLLKKDDFVAQQNKMCTLFCSPDRFPTFERTARSFFITLVGRKRLFCLLIVFCLKEYRICEVAFILLQTLIQL